MKEIIKETDSYRLYFVKYKYLEPQGQSFNDDIRDFVKVEEYRVKDKFHKKRKLFRFLTLNEALLKTNELEKQYTGFRRGQA